MKYIKKKSEPKSLKEYREKTENATYNGFFDSNHELKSSLLVEQGYICCYCMKKISLDLNSNYKPKVEVEHYKSQKLYPQKQLEYKNMLGVCNGGSGLIEHCDKSKKESELKILNPLLKKSENLITYSLSGKIKSLNNDTLVEEDLKLLNLNNQNLIDIRKNSIDKVWKDIKNNLTKKYPNRTWTSEMYIKELDLLSLDKINSSGKFIPFCNAIISVLKKRLR